jgi:hypothetical protein
MVVNQSTTSFMTLFSLDFMQVLFRQKSAS